MSSTIDNFIDSLFEVINDEDSRIVGRVTRTALPGQKVDILIDLGK